jgi:hypothetical protein
VIGWLDPDIENIPDELRQYPRFLGWTLDAQGRKVPRSPHRPNRNCDATNPKNWGSWDQLLPVLPYFKGPAIALGDIQPDRRLSGIDLDHCYRDGRFEPWALSVINDIDSYTERSPSPDPTWQLKRERLLDTIAQIEDGARLDSAGELFQLARAANMPNNGLWRRGINWITRRLQRIEEELAQLPESSDDPSSVRNPNRVVTTS